MNRIVIFASGSGSNAENIINYFKSSNDAIVSHVLSNNANAKVFDRCKRLNVPCTYFSKDEFLKEEGVLSFLKEKADYIVLAGFLWKIPSQIVSVFANKIINIHPALLPKYGGKGMYGMHVHKAVKENNEKETGITIHFVNEHYDEGAIIFQAQTPLSKEDSPEQIAQKVHALEYEHFPREIEKIIMER